MSDDSLDSFAYGFTLRPGFRRLQEELHSFNWRSPEIWSARIKSDGPLVVEGEYRILEPVAALPSEKPIIVTGQPRHNAATLECAFCGNDGVLECTYKVDHSGDWCGKWVCHDHIWQRPRWPDAWCVDHAPDTNQGRLL